MRGWQHPGPSNALDAMDIVYHYEPLLRDLTGGVIILVPDRIQTTVDILLPVQLRYSHERNYQFVSVAECLGEKRGHWYTR